MAELPPIIDDIYAGEYAYVRADLAPNVEDAVRLYNAEFGTNHASDCASDGGVVGMFPAPKKDEPDWYAECAPGKGKANYRKVLFV